MLGFFVYKEPFLCLKGAIFVVQEIYFCRALLYAETSLCLALLYTDSQFCVQRKPFLWYKRSIFVGLICMMRPLVRRDLIVLDSAA